MSKYFSINPTITVYDRQGYGTTVSDDLTIQVARAIVALDNAERKFARAVENALYPYDIG